MKRYATARWEQARQSALRRAGYICEECKRHGVTTHERLHVHHLWPRDERPDLFHDQRNLYVLCATCHNKMEDRNSGALTALGKATRDRLTRRRGIPPS